jgi:diacylglycerol O-acyltransferase / wax synthase
MRQLRPEDARFVFADSGHANANVTLVYIYDPTHAGDGRVHFKELLAHIGSRLHLSPVFRQKLLRVPLDLDLPYWIEDERFDLEYHVRHIALPSPGDWRQFCIQASRIHARPLDMSRPLWEMYLVEGLDSFLDLPKHSFAILTKTHHAAIDDQGAAEITWLLHDLTPDPIQPSPPEPWFPESPPGLLSMMARATVNSVSRPFAAAAPLARTARRLAPVVLGTLGDALLNSQSMPISRFNAEVSPHRVFETRRFTLEEFKQIRALVPGASVNDVVLAVCGGALRRYLARHEELPADSLLAELPLSTRAGGATAGATQVSMLRVPLGTEIEDPVERLRGIRKHTAGLPLTSTAVGAKEQTDHSKHVSSATVARAARLSAGSSIGQPAPRAACTIMNVPGPSVPLYLDGARMTYFSAILPISDGMGLAFAVTSYDDRVIVSPTSCREQMPDPEFFALCIREVFQDYLAIAVEFSKSAAARRALRRASPRAPAARKAAKRPPVARAGRRGSTSRPR